MNWLPANLPSHKISNLHSIQTSSKPAKNAAVATAPYFLFIQKLTVVIIKKTSDILIRKNIAAFVRSGYPRTLIRH